MPVSNTSKLSPVWIVGAAAAFAACFALGHLIGGDQWTLGAGDPRPLMDGRRYEVPVTMTQPKRGPNDALVTIVEWCDLKSDACKRSELLTKKLRAKYPEDLRHVWRHFLDPTDPPALIAHEFARIALEQSGKFWEVRDLLFQRTSAAAPTTAEFERYAQKAGLDWRAVQEGLEKHNYRPYVLADGLFADRFGVRETATFYVNGRRLFAPVTEDRLERLVAQELEHAKKVVAGGVLRENVYAKLIEKGLFEPPLPMVAKAQ